MNGRVAKRIRQAVNDMYGNLESVQSKKTIKELKKAYKDKK